MYDDKELKQFDRLGIKRPEHLAHGVTLDDVSTHLRRLKPHSWRLVGNKLHGMTDMGELVQTIPTDNILIGTDSDGLPIFQKIQL